MEKRAKIVRLTPKLKKSHASLKPSPEKEKRAKEKRERKRKKLLYDTEAQFEGQMCSLVRVYGLRFRIPLGALDDYYNW